MEDHRKKKDGDDSDFIAGIDSDTDEQALEMENNPLAEEEKIEEDDTGND